ncbi:hypothetical protein Hanom_Chr12g01130311 [Helianthus anomalus]
MYLLLIFSSTNNHHLHLLASPATNICHRRHQLLPPLLSLSHSFFPLSLNLPPPQPPL